MAQVTCSRCFAVFDAPAARPGLAPLCPACAPRPAAARARVPAAAAPSPRRPRRSGGGRRVAIAVGAVALLAAGGATAALLWPREPPAPPPPSAVDARVEAWREAGLLPPAQPRDAAAAEARMTEAAAALAADLPGRTADALRLYREALALHPRRSDAAIAGYVTAFAESAGEDPDGVELRGAHALVRAALADGARPDLQAAYARLLLVVPSAPNVEEALAIASQAAAAAPAEPSGQLALGLARQRADPAAAARLLEQAAAVAPADRRLLTAAARARWAAGDAAGALSLADRRLALDPAHPGALELKAEVLAACDRTDEARRVLASWAVADPDSPVPPLLLARLAYQRGGDLAEARRLLDASLARRPDDFVAARALSHRAAVELLGGEVAAAEAAVAQALARVPGSAPARFQAALLAFRRADAASLRESAGVLGSRGGTLVERLLAARSAELSGTHEDAQEAYRAVAAAAPRDPAVLLAVAGALARLHDGGLALEIAGRALDRDVVEGRLRRAPTDFWEGPGPLADASRRLEAIARVESRGGSRAYAAAAAAELLLGRPAEADRLARLSAAASPQSIFPLVILGQAALDRGQTRQAVLVANAAVAAHPHEPLALELRARVLEALGRGHDAEIAHRHAAEAGPDLVTPRLALARLLVRRGEAGEARAVLEALLGEEPGLAEARGALVTLASAPAPNPRQP
jgi:tetratricopeptide (TPR) repeat protein